ncbi:MAG: TIGR02147 family protein [Myxococcales bacterium]|nr:TIGR02147 family protein [Myxococcales bacterium]MDD9970265.1 TIGR02147 family protein [Myxococcales bacterium]
MNTSQAELPHVFDYLNYREYLKQFYAAKKAQGRGFSFRLFAKRAGVSASNHLKRVMDGSRNLPDATARRYANALGLAGDEAEYFCELVRFNQADETDHRQRLYGRLTGFRGYRKAHRLELAHAAYYANWYVPAIRELAVREDFRADPTWLAKQLVPPITPLEAKQALATLFELGLLVRDAQGSVSQGEPVAATPPETAGLHVANYHAAMGELAIRSLREQPSDARDLSSLTMCIAAGDMEMLKRRIQRFREELVTYATQVQDGDQVVQLNFQLFPLTCHRSEESRE